MCSSASGANPKHSLELAITPATNVPWPSPEQEYLLLTYVTVSQVTNLGFCKN